MKQQTALGAAFMVGAAFVIGAASPSTAATAATAAHGVQRPVIVLLRDQHTETPPTTGDDGRRAVVPQSDQRPLVDQVRDTGATHVSQFSVINGFAASVTSAESARLATDPQVAAVVPDLPIKLAALPEEASGAMADAAPPKPNPAVCPSDPKHPLLEPEALQVTHDADSDPDTPQAQRLATGKGVTVAYLADGIDTNNPDFIRPDGSHVFTDFRDFTGEGTKTPNDDREAFGDASAIAAQGRQRYDLSTFVGKGNPLPKNCDIRVLGMAPGASLVGLKVIASNGFGSTSAVVQAIDYAVSHDHVNVINESLGANPYPDTGDDPLTLANDAAVAAGVTVVNSSGDSGYANTIGSPASDPKVISTGASTTYRIIAQTWDALPGFHGTWESDNISAISSSGVTESGRVYDLVAPGDLGWALCSANTKTHIGCTNYRSKPSPIQAFGGTSEASPLTAGAAALVIQAYAQTHGGTKPTPALVKQILTSTATDNGDPAQRQGAGLLNALAAVQAAMSVSDAHGSPQPQGNGLLFGQSQLDATANPNSPRLFDLSVTNVGAHTQTIIGHGRNLDRTLSDVRGSVNLDTSAASNLVGRSGAADNYVRKTFTVGQGADHLDASIAWADPNGDPTVLVLLDPKGAFAGYSLPQSATGPDFGHVDVHSPMPGAWTALIYRAHSKKKGFDGPVDYEFTTTRYTNFGAVLGVLRLPPGRTGTLRVVASTPGRPGDLAAAVEVDTARRQRFAVPLVLRSLVANTGRGTFSGVLTGGNGRPGAPAQSNTFAFDVPQGKRDIDVSLTLHGSPSQGVLGFLVSPDGEILSQATNVLTADKQGNPTEYGSSLDGYLRDPLPGRWQYVVEFQNSVAGDSTREPFSGTLRFDQVDVSASGVPASGATLPAGKPVTATVQVHNTGTATHQYYVDGRTSTLTDATLVADGPASKIPLAPSASLGYLVPPDTTQVTGVVSGSAPVTADLAPNTGEPEHLGAPGAKSVASVTSPEVSQGLWLLEADPVGPFDAPKPRKVDFSAVAHTQAFDPAVTSSAGDHWLGSVQAKPPAFHPLTVDAGQTGGITVTFTPKGPKGTVVQGWLYVDDTTLADRAGDELSAIPYSYTVG